MGSVEVIRGPRGREGINRLAGLHTSGLGGGGQSEWSRRLVNWIDQGAYPRNTANTGGEIGLRVYDERASCEHVRGTASDTTQSSSVRIRQRTWTYRHMVHPQSRDEARAIGDRGEFERSAGLTGPSTTLSLYFAQPILWLVAGWLS
jgi:hypothetical protein